MTYTIIKDELLALANERIAEHSSGYFKTAEGEYGYGDQFLGIRMPVIRQLVKKYIDADLNTLKKLLRSEYHEIRLFSLISMVSRFNKAKEETRQEIYDMYLDNTQNINNWDLVDSSAHYIVGQHLLNRGFTDKELMNKSGGILYKLVTSSSLWERRIAVLATFQFIRNKKFDVPLQIYEILLEDKEDLIHKSVGWMLRELGKRDKALEEKFLKKHLNKIPRTMLRYAIEKFSKEERQQYLKGTI
ncbi:MAG: DNA alkylation repair protein [Bermanella sp.]